MHYSLLDLAPVREGGTVAEALRNTADLARHAELWGYTRYWLAEHHNMPGIASAATAVLIGHVAAATSSIRVGSGGVMLPNHTPIVIAEQFGTLETLYPGRIDLGIGRAPGSDGYASHALRRGMHMKEEQFPRDVSDLLAYLAPPAPSQLVQAFPGGGANVPVWLLGSSTYSAQLASGLGLPFAFASHFAPDLLHEAIRLYREGFQPSSYLDSPYVMAGVPIVAADSDAEAQRLATSLKLRHLRLIRGAPIYVPPPVDSMEGLWSEPERQMVESRLSVAVIGGPEHVEKCLAGFVHETGVDEVMFTCDLYDHAARLRSFEIAGEVMRRLHA